MPRARRLLVMLALGLAGLCPGHAGVVFLAPASHADFSIRLFWFHEVGGRFDQMYGNLAWSPDAGSGVVRAWINVDSAQLRERKFLPTLLGPDFLDAARYPRIAFVSDPLGLHVLREGGVIRGRLTLHGVTRQVTFRLRPSRCIDPLGTPCTLRLDGRVQRASFGMRAHEVILSDRVQLNLVVVLQPLLDAAGRSL